MKKAVGFDQKITVSQLDKATKLCISGTSLTDCYNFLDQSLAEEVSGEKSRKNVITILAKIWLLVNPEHQWLKEIALKLYQDANLDERLALHWGMILLAYPFFRDCVDVIGRQIIVSGSITSQQVFNHIKNIYGDRRRVDVSKKAVLTTLRSLNVLMEENKKEFKSIEQIAIYNDKIGTWLGAVTLYASGKDAMPLDARGEAFMFPFTYRTSRLTYNEFGLPVVVQGLDAVYVCRKGSNRD